MEKEYNKYLWSPKQPRVYGISPLTISGTPMSEEDVAASLKVENSQQRFQQNPVVKRSEQWEAQQKQREEEIAASKKWLELHPEDESDSPYTILERGKHQAIVDGKDPSYYEKMIDDGKQFTKGALSVLSLPYLSAAAAGVYGYGASLGARGLFAGQGIYGLANKDGVRKTANLIKSHDYGRAALSGAGDALNAAMVLPGAKLLGNAAKFLGSTAKYGLKSTVAGNMLSKNVLYNAPNMETVADYTNRQIFDNLMKYPNKEYNDTPVYMDLNTVEIKKVKNPELVKFEFWQDKFGDPVELKKATDEFGNEVFLHSFDRNQGKYVDNTPLNRDQKFIHYRASEGYDGKTLFPKADNKVDPVGHIWFNANSSAHSFPDKYKLEHFAIDPIPSTGHPWSKSFRLVSDPVDVSNAIHTKYNPITLGLETQIKPFTPLKNTSMDKTSYAFFERPSKLSEAERLGIPKGDRGNLSQDQLDALEDLTSYMQSGRYKNKFVIDQAGNFAWKSNLGPEDTPALRAFADAKGDFWTRWASASTKEGTFEYITDRDYGAPINGGFTAAFPKPEGMKWGPGELASRPQSKHSIDVIMTSPKVDAIDAGLEDPIVHSLANTIDPGIVKNWWIRTKQMSRPGSYLSGDAGQFPIGFRLLQDVDKHKFGNIANDLLYPDITNVIGRQGLSPDSYASIVKQGLRDGNSLRFGDPFFKWNPSAIKNKYIYDAFTQYKKGEISIDQYKETVDNWLKSMGVNKQSFIKDGKLMIPHPFVYYNKQGGILKRVESGKSGIHIKPENRGKFTALKKRTGKSSTWYKEHGTPAQKKMAVFALNARKWKHK